MKRIRAKFDQRDRVVCIRKKGENQFWYQPFNSGKPIKLLFGKTCKASNHVAEYFCEQGRRMNGQDPSLTIREIYMLKRFHKKQLQDVLECIPTMIEYILRYELDQGGTKKRTTVSSKRAACGMYNEDDDFAA